MAAFLEQISSENRQDKPGNCDQIRLSKGTASSKLKVRTEIDGLPFTTEGYERAKNILVSEYGKTSEIVNVYVQNIINLPVITGTQPSNIHEFYKTLVYNVQSLETLGRRLRKYKKCARQPEGDKDGSS